MYCIQRKEELGEARIARSNSADDSGWSSGAVAVRSYDLDLDLEEVAGWEVVAVGPGSSSSSSDDDSASSFFKAEADQSNPPETSSAADGTDVFAFAAVAVEAVLAG